MAKLKELARFFGLSALTTVVIAAAFLVFRAHIKQEIQQSVFRQLTETAQQQADELRRALELTTTQMQALAEFGANEAKRAALEPFFFDLNGGEGMAWTSFANLDGTILSGPYKGKNVADADWFQRCADGENIVDIARFGSGAEAVVLAVPVWEGSATGAVLLASMEQDVLSEFVRSDAFSEGTYSLLARADGDVIAIANQTTKPTIDANIFDFVTDNVLRGKTVAELRQALENGEMVVSSLELGGRLYYSADVPVGVGGWYIVLTVESEVADTLSGQMLPYVVAMLCLVIFVNVVVIMQAYKHEKQAVTALEREKDLLRQSGERYALINRLSNEVLFTVDMETGRIDFNDSFEGMFGFVPPACTIDHAEVCASMVVESDRPLFYRFVERMNAGSPQAHEELRMLNAHGVARWKRLEIYTVYDKDGFSRQVVGKISDIQRQRASLLRLKKKADSDPLTGLLNRAAMERNTRVLLAGAGREEKHAFLILDFDNFKQVNDTLGHSEGDRLLVEFAEELTRLFRADDSIARMGGDEYAMLMKYVDSVQSALDKAQQVRRAMERVSAAFGMTVTVSIGIAIYTQDGGTFDELYKAADAALYRVKNSGKNACALYSEQAIEETEQAPEHTKETEDQHNGNDRA